MNTSDRIFSTRKPESREVARARQLLATGALALSALGVGIAVEAATDENSPRPTRAVEVQPGDTGVVWDEARSVATAQGGDIRDVVDEIQANSPDLSDGIAHPGDVLRVPMTQDQIAQQEQQAQDNNG